MITLNTFATQAFIKNFLFSQSHLKPISSYQELSTSRGSPRLPLASARLKSLSRPAVLACQAIRTTRAVVASVSSAKEISYVAQGVRHHVTLPRHSVWPLPGASRENEEEIWSPALASGSPESRAVPVGATVRNFFLTCIQCEKCDTILNSTTVNWLNSAMNDTDILPENMCFVWSET